MEGVERMKALMILAVLLMASASTFGQTPCERPPSDTPLQRLLKQRDSDWGRALISRDERLLNELLDDDFTLTNPSGGLTNKRNHIRDILEGNFVITSHEADDVCVRVYGDTAVVTARVRTVARNRARDLSGEFRTIRVYVKRGSSWKLVAHQATRSAQPQAP
jgi:ketosteroid isomerase-like protein